MKESSDCMRVEPSDPVNPEPLEAIREWEGKFPEGVLNTLVEKQEDIPHTFHTYRTLRLYGGKDKWGRQPCKRLRLVIQIETADFIYAPSIEATPECENPKYGDFVPENPDAFYCECGGVHILEYAPNH